MARAIARPPQTIPTAEELWARLYNHGRATPWPSVDAIKQWLPYQRLAVATWLDHPASVVPPDCVQGALAARRGRRPTRAKKTAAKKKGKARR